MKSRLVLSISASQVLDVLLLLLIMSTVTSVIGIMIVRGFEIVGWLIASFSSICAITLTAFIRSMIKERAKRKRE